MTEEKENSQDQIKQIEGLKLTLEGELMEDGNIEYKTLVRALTGTTGALDEIARLANFRYELTYRVSPPKQKCFEITIQSIGWIGAVVPLLPGMETTVKSLITFFIEYVKLKTAMRGEPITRDKIQANGNKGIFIKGSNNNLTFNISPEFAMAAIESTVLNKKIDEAATSIAKDTAVDSLKYSLLGEKPEEITITKSELDYLRFSEEFHQQEDQLVGYVREIDNTDYKGNLNVIDGVKIKMVKFELDIKDISRLEETVSNLCIAEAKKARVALVGEKILHKNGRIKLVKVYDIRIIDGDLGI